MNYIAHSVIAQDFDYFVLGQLLGDFAVSRDLEGRDEKLIRGVKAHRALDRFTDSHEGFINGVKLLEADCGRYAPVIMDVYMDWVLVRHWDQLVRSTAFADFINILYNTIERLESSLPARMETPACRMRTMDWLSGFAEIDALHTVFYYMAKRVRRPEWIQGAADAIDRLDGALEPFALKVLRDPDLRNFAESRY